MRGRFVGGEYVDPGKVAIVEFDDVAGPSRERIGEQQVAVIAWSAGNSKGLDGGLAAHEREADTRIEPSGRFARYSLI